MYSQLHHTRWKAKYGSDFRSYGIQLLAACSLPWATKREGDEFSKNFPYRLGLFTIPNPGSFESAETGSEKNRILDSGNEMI